MISVLSQILAQAQSSGNAPGLLVLLLVALLVIVAVLGAGAVIGAAIVATITAAMAFGMISTSVLVGLKERKIAAGAQALIVQIAAVAGFGLGAGALLLTAWLAHLRISVRAQIACALFCGCITAIACALLANTAWNLALACLSKLNASTPRQAPIGQPTNNKR